MRASLAENACMPILGAFVPADSCRACPLRYACEAGFRSLAYVFLMSANADRYNNDTQNYALALVDRKSGSIRLRKLLLGGEP